LYDTPEELLREIMAGEDSFLDLKEVFFRGEEIRFEGKGKAADELAKDLCCFANAEGGVLLFGVRDDGERVGLPREGAGRLQQLLLNVAQHNVEPPLGHLLTFDRVLLPDSSGEEKLCLKVEIKKAAWSVHAPLGKRPTRRVGDQCLPMTLEQQARLFERRGLMLPFEERPSFRARFEDLDLARFRAYYERRYGAALDAASLPLERLLTNLKVLAADEVGQLHPTALGLLLFSPEPERFLPGAYVDVAIYRSDVPDSGAHVDTRTFRGPLVEQIERTFDFLRYSPYLPVADVKEGFGRRDLPAYSLRAVQEAVVNALVHRDYGVEGAQVRVFLFLDRIEISNPGRLPNSLTPENLFAGCQPVRRNQMLAGFLRDFASPLTHVAYMEGRGEGFLTLVRECEKVSGRPPRLDLVGDSVRLTIYSAYRIGELETPAAPAS
jgi:ATP-dependent DNA helicase RecG